MGLDHKELEDKQINIPCRYTWRPYQDVFSTCILPPRRDGLNTAELFHVDYSHLYWKHSRWCPVGAECFGTSWLEVLAYYKAIGGLTYHSDYDDDSVGLDFTQKAAGAAATVL